MYQISATGHFDAAHFLRGYAGKCAKNHGHRWVYSVVIEGPELDELGMLVDFGEIKKMMKENIEDYLDHSTLNRAQGFRDQNPTAENISKLIYKSMWAVPKGLKLKSVTVWETPECSATYSE